MNTDAVGPNERRRTAAALSLVVANLLVVAVALYGDWAYYAVLIAFWIELLIIGGFNVLRILTVFSAGDPLGPRVGMSAGSRLVGALVAVIFFVAKYGGITLGAGLVVLGAPAIMAPDSVDRTASLLAGLRAVGPALGIATVVLAVSHGFSFFVNFLGRGEYRRARILGLLFLPYARVIGTVVVLYLGFLATLAYPGFDRTTVFIVVVVSLKTLVDLLTHRLEHRRRLPAADGAG